MRLLIDYARARGIGTLFGDVLAENTAMLALTRNLGFTATPQEAGILRVTLPLTGPALQQPSLRESIFELWRTRSYRRYYA